MKDSTTAARRSFARAGRALPRLLALGVLFLGACSDPRHDAATELLRLDKAMQRHAAQYGRFPETLDSRSPASRANLPHAPERKVELRLLSVTEDGYVASARRGSWVCGMSVDPRQKAQPDCFPSGASSRDLSDTVGKPAPGPERVLPLWQNASPADSIPKPR